MLSSAESTTDTSVATSEYSASSRSTRWNPESCIKGWAAAETDDCEEEIPEESGEAWPSDVVECAAGTRMPDCSTAGIIASPKIWDSNFPHWSGRASADFSRFPAEVAVVAPEGALEMDSKWRLSSNKPSARIWPAASNISTV